MTDLRSTLIAQLFARLAEVRAVLGWEPPPDDPEAPFADLLASMGTVEFRGRVADDCAVAVEVVEGGTRGGLTHLSGLADALLSSGLHPHIAAPISGRATTSPSADAGWPAWPF